MRLNHTEVARAAARQPTVSPMERTRKSLLRQFDNREVAARLRSLESVWRAAHLKTCRDVDLRGNGVARPMPDKQLALRLKRSVTAIQVRRGLLRIINMIPPSVDQQEVKLLGALPTECRASVAKLGVPPAQAGHPPAPFVPRDADSGRRPTVGHAQRRGSPAIGPSLGQRQRPPTRPADQVAVTIRRFTPGEDKLLGTPRTWKSADGWAGTGQPSRNVAAPWAFRALADRLA
jgi:hypothetical protein